jgi:REP element-mobilizing transposase RayT
LPHTYSANLYHIVFSTKDRINCIHNPQSLWGYCAGTARNVSTEAIAIGGTSNHVHLLLRVAPHFAVAEITQKIKANSSRWLRQMGSWPGWQEGYGSFTVSISNLAVVRRYIHNQPQHHATRSFEDEFIALLTRGGVVFDRFDVFS